VPIDGRLVERLSCQLENDRAIGHPNLVPLHR
jgi:hypothetical protein